jgi:PAS domain S-box-containing protein
MPKKLTALELQIELEKVQKRAIELETMLKDKGGDDRFFTAFHTCPSQMAFTELNTGKYLEVNEAFLNSLGFSREEVIGKTALELNLFANPAQRAELLARMAKQGYLMNERVLVKSKSGELRHGIFSANYVYENGQKYILTVMNDVTENDLLEARWHYALEGAGDGVWDWNPQTDKVFFSPRWKSILGYEDDEISNSLDEWSSRVHPDDLPMVMEEVNKHFRGDVPTYSSEHRLRCKDGSYKWILDRGMVMERSKDGKPLRVIGTHKDITDRKNMELALEAEAVRRHILFEESPDGVLVINPETARFVEFNTKAHTQLGYTREEFSNLSIFDIEVHETSEETRTHIGEVVKNGRSDFETLQRTKQGEIRNIHVTAQVVEIAGQPVYYCIWRDITERKRAEEARRESDERYHLLFRNMVQGVVFHDKDGFIIHANPAAERILGLSTDQLMGRASIDPRWHAVREDGSALPGEEHPAMIALRTGEPVYDVVMGVFNPAIESFVWINVNATPRFFGDSEKPYQVFATFEDITLSKKAELELRESEKRLRSMLEISQAMSAPLEMGKILQKIVESAKGLLKLESGAIYTLKGEELFLEATTPPLPPDFPDEFRRANVTDHPHIQAAVAKGSAVILPDTTALELSNAERMIAESRGLRSIVYVPLMISEQAIGVLVVASVDRLRTFSDEEIALYNGFSGQAAQTIENIRLYEVEHEYAAELKAQIAERILAEDNLRESERKYRDLINGMNDTVWVIDLDSNFLDVNDASVKELGYSREELLSMKVSDIDSAIAPDQIFKLIDKLRIDKQLVFETLHTTKDGKKIPVEVSGSLISYMGKTVIMSIARDITDRKKAEESLNKSQSLLKEAQRIARIGHMEWNGRDQALICSDEIYDIFELPRGTMVDQYIIGQMVSSEERKRLNQLDLQAAQQHTDVEYEYSIRLKDGSIRWLHQMGQVVYDEDGNSTRMMIIVQDITERKNAEHTLKENRSRLEMALKGANAGMWDWNVQTGETAFNERWAEIVGYSLKELEPISIKTWTDLCHPDDLQRSETLLQRHFAGETEFYECEARMKHKNGAWVWVLDQGKVMEWDEECKPVRMFGTHLDITKQKREELYTQAVLRLTNISYETSNMEDLMRAMLDEAEALTGSTIGFFHFVDANQNSINLQAWSTNTLTNLCTAEGKGQHYSVDQAGIWADAIRSGEPHIYNDYPSLTHRKGLPKGHAPVSRLISLPVKRNNLVVAALGVGNKAQDYTEQDLDTLKNLAETVFDIVMRKRAEEALRINEERLRTVADFTYDMEFWLDENQNLLYVSPSCERITGYERETFLKNPSLLRSIVHPEDQPIYDRHMTEGFDGSDSCSLDFRIITADGAVRWINHTCQAVWGEHGEFRGRRVSHRDITERRHVLEELRASEEKYRGLLESLHSVVANVDLDGRFLYMNDTAAEQMGGTTAQFIGRTMFELFPLQVADHQMRDIQAVTAADKGMVFENLSYVNGQQRWYRTSIEPLHGENVQVISVLINSTDIHELKTMQQELQVLNRSLEERVKERTAQVQDLYDNAPSGYHSVDADGNVAAINQTELNWLGYTREELFGKPFTTVLAPSSIDIFTKNFPKLKRDGRLNDLEIELMCKDGTTFPALLNAVAVYSEDGHYQTSRSNLTDITERKRAEDALRNVNKELEHALRVKDEFLANMSHELRTPLNGILGFSEILLNSDFGKLSERQHKYVTSIEASGKHLLGLINDLLDLAKIESGKLELLPENVIISELCQSSLLFVRQMALKKKIQLSYEQDMDIPFIIGDQRRLKQILVNLLSNAVKFTPDNGKVTLRVLLDPLKGGINFSVEDTGIGISAEDLQRLFTPFTQVDSSLTRQHEGTGLGLALVQKLAELHGGGVIVQSEIGKGSTFTVCIPENHDIGLDDHKEKQAVVESIVETSQEKTYSGKILLAEDIESNIMLLGDYLEYQGYEMIYAQNGQEALDKAKETLPDLILMDIQMPVMDGLEATRRLRADSRFATVPIIALTALAMTGDRERCFEAGATDYISKPMNLKKLEEMIQTLLEANRS